MGTATDAKSFSNISATTAAFTLQGGYYLVTCKASAYGANGVELQTLAVDGSTWLSMPTALKLTANGTIAGYCPGGQYRFTLDGSASAVYCSVASIPNI